MKNTETFNINFDSDSTKEHVMDAEDMASSVLNLSRAIKHAQIKIYGKGKDVAVGVKAHTPGSFGVDYQVLNHLVEATAILKIIGLVSVPTTLVGGGLIDLIKKIKGRDINVVVHKKNNKTPSDVVLSDGETIQSDARVATLVADSKLRDLIEKAFFDPTKADPTTKIKISQDDKKINKVSNQQLVYFRKPIVESDELFETEHLHIDTKFPAVNFDGKSGWAAIIKGTKKSVVMDDESFLKQVQESQQNFSKNDTFSAKIKKTTQKKTGKRKNVEYTVTEVTRHRVSKDRKMVQD
jgi:hypothetical protein